MNSPLGKGNASPNYRRPNSNNSNSNGGGINTPSSPPSRQSSLLTSTPMIKQDLPWLGLKILNLSHNELDSFPDHVIENTNKLQELYLHHNFLEQLPPPHCLVNLVNLKTFTAYNNDIPNMPTALLELLPTVTFMNVIYFIF